MRFRKDDIFPDRPLTVEIRPDDVACAVKGDPYNCVLAKSFKNNPLFAYSNIEDVRVLRQFTVIYLPDNKRMIYSTPKELRPEIDEWDKPNSQWRGPSSGSLTFNCVIPNRRTPEQKERTKAQDAIRKPKFGKALTVVNARHLKIKTQHRQLATV